MYKKDLVLKNLQWLLCHKTQPNQTYLIHRWLVLLHVNLRFLMLKSFFFQPIMILTKYSNLIIKVIIWLHTVVWFQATSKFLWKFLLCRKQKNLDFWKDLWPTDETLTCIHTSLQSGSGSNSNEVGTPPFSDSKKWKRTTGCTLVWYPRYPYFFFFLMDRRVGSHSFEGHSVGVFYKALPIGQSVLQ